MNRKSWGLGLKSDICQGKTFSVGHFSVCLFIGLGGSKDKGFVFNKDANVRVPLSPLDVTYFIPDFINYICYESYNNQCGSCRL